MPRRRARETVTERRWPARRIRLDHTVSPITLVDEDLLAFESIWAAAGTPNAVFCLTPDELLAMTRGQRAAVKQH